MAYNPNIPKATDRLSQSQADILGNFIAIATQLNPTALTVLFPQVAAGPAPIATTVQLFALADAASDGGTGLFLENATGAAVNPIPITRAVKATPGYTYLPPGIILQWGTGVTPAGAAGNFNFIGVGGVGVINFPTNLFAVMVWINGALGNPSSFTLNSSPINAMSFSVAGHFNNAFIALPFGYLAIGN